MGLWSIANVTIGQPPGEPTAAACTRSGCGKVKPAGEAGCRRDWTGSSQAPNAQVNYRKILDYPFTSSEN